MEDEPPHGEPGEPAATPRAPGPQVLDDDRAFPVRFLLSAPACGAPHTAHPTRGRRA